ncbi:proline dehydrogenase family protein [Dokdonia sp. Hel_I_53]|uniref:proline dehydrogenase family protein n=1 Tax=Dokdonia sp. Hel_I_53 TaxID=1566287 RepID=UPI0011990B53|nr:proline dehydrogenase family protein [Dokdonia sp. Hel_I_53]TVZ51575.1 L-proline dehydrogenase [Dokdonia sp. Hel_I_53]
MNDTLTSSLFENTKNAFALKSDSELERAYFLFKMISKQPLVRIGTAVTRFALNANLPVEGLIRSTVFDHFCGGVNEDDCMSTVDKLYEANVCSVLDYSVEGKEEDSSFDQCMNKVISLTKFSEHKEAMPISVFKPSGVGRFALWQKVNEKKSLTETEQREWKRVKERVDLICKTAYDCDIEILIDAEESWIQDAADTLVTEMMAKYNKEKAIVYNTLQCYRHDRLDYLKKLHAEGIERDFRVGVKIVRGAYMEKENQRALEKGYLTPICANKAATDKNFNHTLRYIFDHIKDMSPFLGTHNEDSCLLATEIMHEIGLAVNDERVWFGQLYGMSDHISFNLADKGYNVAKYMPFGPVKDVMPYLIRRAEENTSVAGQTNRELELLKAEKKRRKL